MNAPGVVLAGRYRLTRELGRGATASVWCADDPILDRAVAVKMLHPIYARDPEALDRFRAVATRASRLSHPGIVSVYEVVTDAHRAYVVTEFVDGVDLGSVLAARAPLSISEAADIGAQVAATLAYAHQQGVLHLDLKPTNVLVRSDGRVQLSDFGFAAHDDGTERTEAGSVAGLARYLAPEQIRGEATGERTDVYGAGLLIYEMLTGAPARGASGVLDPLGTIDAPVPTVARNRRDIPPRFGAVVDRSLAPQASDRIDAAALAAALSPFRADVTPAGGTPSARLASPSPRVEHRRSGRRTAGFVAFTVLAVLVAAAAIVLTARDDPSATTPTTTVAAPQPIEISSVVDFDPDGDGDEHSNEVGALIDGDDATAWDSETYTNRDFGGGKPGLGLVLDLGRSVEVGKVQINGEPGWSGELLAADESGATRDAWGAPLSTIADAGNVAAFELSEPTETRYLLVWFTQLPPGRQLVIRSIDVES